MEKAQRLEKEKRKVEVVVPQRGKSVKLDGDSEDSEDGEVWAEKCYRCWRQELQCLWPMEGGLKTQACNTC